MRFRNAFAIATIVSVYSCGQADPSKAALVHWTVQSTQSSLTVTGTATLGSTTLASSPQGANSNVSPISGTFDTNLNLGSDIDVLTANLSLNNSGNWSPLAGGALGTAPADIGLAAFFTKLAGRSMTISLDTPALALTGGPALYTFGVTGTTNFTGGFIDYNVTLPPGLGGTSAAARSSDFVGSGGPITGAGGTLSIVGGLATLTIPYSALNVPAMIDDMNTADPADDITSKLNLTGIIVATAQVPEPSSFAISAMALLSFGAVARFRRR